MATEKRLRVAHVITTISRGGATENTFLTALGSRALGVYDVTILAGPAIAAEGSMIRQAEDSGLAVEIIPSLGRDIHPVSDIRAFFQLYRAIKRGGYDIVHTHGSKGGILGRLAARIVKTPTVVHTFHALPYGDYSSAVARRGYIWLERLAAKWTHGALSVSQTVVDRLIEDGIGSPGWCEVVRSGMDLQAFLSPEPGREDMRRKWGLVDTDVAVGTIGRVHTGKGQDVLIRLAPKIVRQAPHVRLVIIGTGPLVEPLEDEVTRLGLQNHVKFVGFIDPTDMPVAISALDVLVHASDREGLARVIPQAMACRKPVVSYNLDGSPEVITDGHNGRLIEPHNDDELVDAIRQIANDEQLRLLWGERGPAVVDPAFRAETMALGTDRVYRRLLAKIGVDVPPARELAPLSEWRTTR